MMMMAAAMKKAKSTEGEAVRDAIEKLGHYEGAGASYDFSPEQHVGITQESLRDRLGRRTASWFSRNDRWSRAPHIS